MLSRDEDTCVSDETLPYRNRNLILLWLRKDNSEYNISICLRYNTVVRDHRIGTIVPRTSTVQYLLLIIAVDLLRSHQINVSYLSLVKSHYDLDRAFCPYPILYSLLPQPLNNPLCIPWLILGVKFWWKSKYGTIHSFIRTIGKKKDKEHMHPYCIMSCMFRSTAASIFSGDTTCNHMYTAIMLSDSSIIRTWLVIRTTTYSVD